MEVVFQFSFAEFVEAVLSKGIWLIIVIAIDLILGVTVAILVRKDFQWKHLTDFLVTNLPKLVGWLAFEVLAFIPSELVPSGAEILTENAGNLVFLLYMGQLIIGSIFGHMMAIGILPKSATRVGIVSSGDKNKG